MSPGVGVENQGEGYSFHNRGISKRLKISPLISQGRMVLSGTSMTKGSIGLVMTGFIAS